MDPNREPAILEMVAALVAVLDREGRIVGWNSACEKASGFALEEVRGRPFWEVAVEPGQGEAVKALFAGPRAGELPDVRESRLIARDGNRRWIAWTNTAVLGADGEVDHVVATGVDVSEHKRAQETLERSQQSMARAQAIARLGSWERDLTTNQVSWSEEMYRLVGLSPNEPLGDYLDFLKLVHPDDRERVKKVAGEAVRDGVPYSADYRMLRKDGTSLPVHATAEVIRDEQGRPRWLAGTAQDITERKRAEEAEHFLSEASKILASSLDYSVTLAKMAELAVPRLADWFVVQVKGEDGALRIVRIVHADPAKADLARDMGRGFITPPTSVGARVMGSGQATVESDTTDEDLVSTSVDALHLSALRRAGIRSRIAVPLVAEGRNLGVLIFATAESGRRYGPEDLPLAEELGRRAALAIANARLYETARRATRAREDLMAVVSHDIRTPLAAIELHASMLQQMLSSGGGNESAAKKVASIRQSASQITTLVGDLLDAAAIEAGKLTVERRPHDAGSILQEASEAARTLAEQKLLRVERQMAQGLPPVFCDRRRVLQALANLLTNAIKFTAAGGTIRIRAELLNGDVTFAVADTGIGISQDALHHLGERYWQADRAKRGSGLGLYIVNGIAQAHGGRLWAESKLGQGSTFFFTVPLGGQPALGRTGLAR